MFEIVAAENVDERKVESGPTFRGSIFVRYKIANANHLFFDEK